MPFRNDQPWPHGLFSSRFHRISLPLGFSPDAISNLRDREAPGAGGGGGRVGGHRGSRPVTMTTQQRRRWPTSSRTCASERTFPGKNQPTQMEYKQRPVQEATTVLYLIACLWLYFDFPHSALATKAKGNACGHLKKMCVTLLRSTNSVYTKAISCTRC